MAETMDALRAEAVRALGDVLRAPGAKPADRLRAAEAILRAERDGLAPTGELHELADQVLMAIARGEGGTPPEMGPTVPRAGAVPSHAGTDRPCTCHPDDNPPVPCPKRYALDECRRAALGAPVDNSVDNSLPGLRLPADGTRNGPAKSDVPPAGNPFLRRVPKKGPERTQNEPANSSLPGALFAPPSEIGHDPDPWT